MSHLAVLQRLQSADANVVVLQEFAGNRPEEACQALLFYLERCRVLDAKSGRHSGHALALEVHCDISTAMVDHGMGLHQRLQCVRATASRSTLCLLTTETALV